MWAFLGPQVFIDDEKTSLVFDLKVIFITVRQLWWHVVALLTILTDLFLTFGPVLERHEGWLAEGPVARVAWLHLGWARSLFVLCSENTLQGWTAVEERANRPFSWHYWLFWLRCILFGFSIDFKVLSIGLCGVTRFSWRIRVHTFLLHYVCLFDYLFCDCLKACFQVQNRRWFTFHHKLRSAILILLDPATSIKERCFLVDYRVQEAGGILPFSKCLDPAKDVASNIVGVVVMMVVMVHGLNVWHVPGYWRPTAQLGTDGAHVSSKLRHWIEVAFAEILRLQSTLPFFVHGPRHACLTQILGAQVERWNTSVLDDHVNFDAIGSFELHLTFFKRVVQQLNHH